MKKQRVTLFDTTLRRQSARSREACCANASELQEGKPKRVVIPGSRSEARNPEVRMAAFSRRNLNSMIVRNLWLPISGFRASLCDPGMTPPCGTQIEKAICNCSGKWGGDGQTQESVARMKA